VHTHCGGGLWRGVGGVGVMRFNIIILQLGGVVRRFDERKGGGGGRKYN